MPDLLLISRDNKSCFELEELGTSKGFRVKSVFDCAGALEWLKMRDFDAAFVDARVDIVDQQKIANLLWQKNPIAHFVAFDLDGDSKFEGREVKLLGADIAKGKDAFKVLNECLAAVKPRGSVKAENFKILVVEDLDSPRDIICAFIEGMGFPAVQGAPSVKAAMQELERAPGEFSCIVTDIKMPEQTGVDLIRSIRHDQKLQSLPIIVLTAYGTVDALVDCLKAGASGFLLKPPKKYDLARELGRAVRIRSRGVSPRLATTDDAEAVREILIQRGFA